MKAAAMDLPDACWGLIFDRLDRQQLLDYISLVSKRFLSISSCCIQTLTISDPNRFLRHCDISRLFGTRFKHIKRLRIRNLWSFEKDDVIDQLVIEIARSGLDLEQLSVSDFEELSSSAIEEIGSKMSNLKSLALNSFGLSNSNLIAVSKFISGLHDLDISYPDNPYGYTYTEFVTEEGIEALASNLKQLRKINLSGHYRHINRSILALFISNCGFLNEFANVLHEEELAIFALRNCSNLNYISLVVGCVSKYESAIIDSISDARGLRALDIKWYYSDTFLCSLAEAPLPSLLKKVKLDLSDISSSIGLSTLFQQFQSLNELNLEGAWWNITDDEMNDCSKYLCNLTHINLSRCNQLTNSTFFNIARNCPLLVEFVMESTRLGKKGKFPPPTDLKKNSQIQFLRLSKNKFLNDETLVKIASICPSLVLFHISDYSSVSQKGTCEILKNCPGIKHLKVTNDFSSGNMILGTDAENSSKLNIEVLETSMIDRGIAMIGMRCPGLLKLNLSYRGVTAEAVKEVVSKCTKLREINLTMCQKIDVDVLYWMLSASLSLRRIIFPHGSRVTEEDRIFFMRRGCQLLGMCEYSMEQKKRIKKRWESANKFW